MPALRVLLYWDTEDYINPESDDALLMLLEEHKKRDIPATWKMVGEKSRVLKERGRDDIISLLSDPLFDIGYHTDFHSAHPTIAEYTEHLNWQEGVAEVLARETDGLRITQETFGRPVLCYGQPGVSYTPHVYEAMRVWDIPSYVGGPVYLGLGDRPSYLMGRLGVVWMREASCSFPARKGEKAIEIAQEKMQEHLASPPPGGLISEGNHPNEWSLSKWWDVVNFSNGDNPVRENWKPAPLTPPDSVRKMVSLFGEYLDWLLARDIEPVSLETVFRLYGPGDFLLDEGTSRTVAKEWAKGDVSYYFNQENGKSLSAAQILFGLSLLVSRSGRETHVPEVDPPTVPVEAPPLASPLPAGTVVPAAKNLAARVSASGVLPPAVTLESGDAVSLEDFAVAVATLFLDAAPGAREGCFLPAGMVQAGSWGVHHPGFTGENLRRLTQCLAWSFKPALLMEQA